MNRTDARKLDAPLVAIHDLLSADEDARACRDIPDVACREQPRNFGVHLLALSMTKIGDGLADAKLILAWLLDALGAPAHAVALLVPVRESLALVPQLAVAAWIRRRAVRKWFWVAGSAAQGMCLIAMALAASLLQGAAAGWTLVALLALFSLARGICSVASKDVLGKTIAKQRRGTLTGYASSVAGVAVIALGALLLLEPAADREVGFFVWLLLVGAGLWLLAAGVYSTLQEQPGATEGGANALGESVAQLRRVVEDRQLGLFLAARACLVSTALMAPFLALLSRELGQADLASLGLLVLASGLAGSVSASVWGRLADASSRLVMAAGGGLAAAVGLAAALLATFAAADHSAWSGYLLAALYFLLSVAHTGVRLGRKTHLVDMAGPDNRAGYVAVSNTLIGVVLLLGGSLGFVADTLGAAGTVLTLALLALSGAGLSLLLEEVQA